MGVRALTSHMTDKKGKDGSIVKCKHNRNMEARLQSKSLFGSLSRASVVSPTTSTSPTTTTGSTSSAAQPVSMQSSTSSTISVDARLTSQTKIRVDTASKDVVICWIRYALDIIHSHHSLNSCGNKGKLFQAMFPGHPNAENFGKLSRGKLKYIITHGLAVYFKDVIMNELAPKEILPPKFTSAFDESFNKVTYSKQMDIHIFYLNKKGAGATCLYWLSIYGTRNVR